MSAKGLRKIDHPQRAARQFLGLINEPLLWARVIGVEGVPPQKERFEVVDEAVQCFLSHYREK